jgi:hypothetical protein
MVKPASIALVITAALLASCASAPYRIGGVTEEQVRAITPIIRAQTSERIISFQLSSDGIVSAHTLYPGRDDSGSVFQLRRIRGKWKIVQEGYWIS